MTEDEAHEATVTLKDYAIVIGLGTVIGCLVGGGVCYWLGF